MPREVVAILTPWLITEDWDFARQGVEIIARKDEHFNYGAGRVENQWCNGTMQTALIRGENKDVSVFYNKFSRAFRLNEVK
jgi:hypothetical protein